MIHEARVLGVEAVSGDDATDYGLTIGSVVTVFGFIEQSRGPMAVISDPQSGAYIIVPYWMLRPEPVKVPA